MDTDTNPWSRSWYASSTGAAIISTWFRRWWERNETISRRPKSAQNWNATSFRQTENIAMRQTAGPTGVCTLVIQWTSMDCASFLFSGVPFQKYCTFPLAVFCFFPLYRLPTIRIQLSITSLSPFLCSFLFFSLSLNLLSILPLPLLISLPAQWVARYPAGTAVMRRPELVCSMEHVSDINFSNFNR